MLDILIDVGKIIYLSTKESYFYISNLLVYFALGVLTNWSTCTQFIIADKILKKSGYVQFSKQKQDTSGMVTKFLLHDYLNFVGFARRS